MIPSPMSPLTPLAPDVLHQVVHEARQVLAEVGVDVEHPPAAQLLRDAGATERDGRVFIDPALVDQALATAPSSFTLYDRDGDNPVRVGGGSRLFAPGSAAVQVWDFEAQQPRPSTLADCAAFARLTDALPGFALQATCVVPTDAAPGNADQRRLALALEHCRKPIVTGTMDHDSFGGLHAQLCAVRGSEAALRERPLAIFDCCPTSPLSWSELTARALIDCARAGIPVEIISVPMTGATGPVTLLGALVQHTAENLSGVVLQQLVAPGGPVSWGSCASAFDMRHGTTPLGAVTTMLLGAGTAQVGRHLGLPTHAYMGLSDAKRPDYQAGLESGSGALMASLAGHDVISGPGMLAFVGCQSLEKLVLDHEAVRLARRAADGLPPREETLGLHAIQQGVAEGQFLKLRHTRRWFRKELDFPGPTIDRQDGVPADAADVRAHAEVTRILGDGA